MLRRPISRIELKMDDLSELEQARTVAKARAAAAAAAASSSSTSDIKAEPVVSDLEREKAIRNERIGYNPMPATQNDS
ncbi:hypothetical protein BOX15_Mlig026040g1 [Macrostomum lignano]|uniref:Uncharacterized protein n=1 Tax=Macrostomum lignano TaxID=282301 RepID=A0A267GY30_9PLAT|nr:hypothetical protein BOX15_Mlig026040g4 [Macrostomum lignano]PAA90930.1 hypothetical protein BOX15_Mlig026040g1 [Macrostomum lignano]